MVKLKFWEGPDSTKITPEILSKAIEQWTPTEVLENFALFLDRVELTNEMVKDEELDIFTHNYLLIQCEDKYLQSEFLEFPWPLQFLPIPEAFATKEVN